MTITITNLKTTAVCPSGAVGVNQNVTIKGTHAFTAKNTGAASATVNITVSIKDSDGHTNRNNVPEILDAGTSRDFTFDTPLLVSYSTAGSKTVTAQTLVDTKSDSATCSLTVG